MALPLMRKATAVWLVENTSLTFSQIANFCGLHELEVSGIADGEVASGIRGMDPITSNQLTEQEIKRCESDPNSKLELIIILRLLVKLKEEAQDIHLFQKGKINQLQ